MKKEQLSDTDNLYIEALDRTIRAYEYHDIYKTWEVMHFDSLADALAYHDKNCPCLHVELLNKYKLKS